MRSWMIGFLLGCGVVSLLPSLLPRWLAAVSFVLCVFVLTATLFRWRSAWGLLTELLAGLLVGLLVGHLHGYALLATRVTAACEATPLTVEGLITSLPIKSRVRDGSWRQRFEFRPSIVRPSECVGPERLLLSYYGSGLLEPGQRWQFQVTLKRPWGLSNPGTFNIQAWYASSGIDGIGSIATKNAKLLSDETDGFYFYHSLRLAIGKRISELGVQAGAVSLLKAITVADKSDISSSTWKLLQQYGVNHLFVISGLHIGLSAGVGYALGGGLARLLFLAGLPRIALVAAPLLALSLAIFYTALAGFTLSAVRALLMLASFVLASLVGKASLSWNNLLIAGVAIVLINPLSILGSGFWLSFSAVATLFWLGMWRSHMSMLQRLLVTHGYMALLMIPLGGWWFGGASQIAAIANVIWVPLVAVFVVPLSLFAVFLFLLELPGDLLLWSIAAWPLEYGIKTAELVSASDIGTGYLYFSPSLTAVILALLALALFIVPLSVRLKCLLPLLVSPIFMPPTGSMLRDEPLMTVTILDVGQGTAAVIRSGRQTMVYDTGGGDPKGNTMASAVVLPFLRYRGVETLQTLMISHPDNDHSAGVAHIQQAMPVEELLVGGDPLNFVGSKPCLSGAAWQWSSAVRFQILSPSSWRGESSNNSSCVLMLHAGDFRMLLAGDIDTKREQELVLYWGDTLRGSVLLASHHGSLSSSSSAWLKATQPQTLVFNNGYLNRFGHPHPVVVERTKQYSQLQYSTSLGGALTIMIPQTGEPQLVSHREAHPRYWR
ncbi:MAG: competence protein ComEC [Halioglobus sp.]|jgi:competence protein ComEC